MQIEEAAVHLSNSNNRLDLTMEFWIKYKLS